MNRLPIGEVARRVGLRPSALRYYEQVGLIAPQPRVGGQRQYDSSVFSTLAVIEFAKRAGFSIAETKLLFTGFGSEVTASARWRAMADRKQKELDLAIASARRMKRLLSLARECRCVTLEQCGKLGRPKSFTDVNLPRAIT
jgi:MerR family transcriptional regulator, redox-sensitive transcriptional activator SoxR